MLNGYNHTDGIDIITSVNGGAKCRIHFQLNTEAISGGGLTTITYTITNFLDSNCTIHYLIVDDQLFPFDSGINPGNIGTAKFTRNGTCVPAHANVSIECGKLEFEFGPLCTIKLNGICSNPTG